MPGPIDPNPDPPPVPPSPPVEPVVPRRPSDPMSPPGQLGNFDCPSCGEPIGRGHKPGCPYASGLVARGVDARRVPRHPPALNDKAPPPGR